MKTALLLYWILCSQILPSEPIFLIQGVVLSKHNDIQTDFSSKYHDKPQTAPKYDILPQGKLAPSLKDIKPTTPRATLAERTKIAETSMIARMRKERIEEVQRRNANKPQYETLVMARQREMLNQRRAIQMKAGSVNRNPNQLSLKRRYRDSLKQGKGAGKTGGHTDWAHNEISNRAKAVEPRKEQTSRIESKIKNDKLGKKERKMAIRSAKSGNGQSKPQSYFITGLDCRTPQSVKHGLLSDVCGTGNRDTAGDTAVPETVSILQYSTKHVVSGVKCTKRVSAINEICGSFSHSKILEPPDILASVHFPSTVCRDTVKRLSYVKEDSNSMPIDLNRSYQYKYIAHGSLTVSPNNVQCVGSTISINGETHSSIVTLITVQLEFTKVQIEVDTHTAMDLDSNVVLPQDCINHELCEDGMSGYVIHHPLSNCPLYLIRSLSMYKVEVNTKAGIKEALVNHDHKVFLVLGQEESADRSCRPLNMITGTQFSDIKVLHKGNTIVENLGSIVSKLSASTLDLTLEMR